MATWSQSTAEVSLLKRMMLKNSRPSTEVSSKFPVFLFVLGVSATGGFPGWSPGDTGGEVWSDIVAVILPANLCC